MKRFALALCVITSLMFGLAGCDKQTGEGWFYNKGCTACKVTFEFKLAPSTGCASGQCPVATSGEFKLFDQNAKKNIAGNFTGLAPDQEVQNDRATDSGEKFVGTCKIDEDGEFPLSISWEDDGDNAISKGDRLEVKAGPYQYEGLIENSTLK